MWSCLRLCPLEASGCGFLHDLLSLIWYPFGFGGFLLAGTLRMRYCSTHFSNKKPVWGLQPTGGVAALIAGVGEVSYLFWKPVLPGREFSGGVRRKRIRLTKKTNVRKHFGFDLGEQPIPKKVERFFIAGSRCQLRGVTSHVDEPLGIG